MRIITDAEKISERCAIALGNFDGLHLAHQKIICECVGYAKKNNLKSGVLIFKNHTRELFSDNKIKQLTPIEEKLALLENLGLDFVCIKDFDKAFMKLSPKEFFDFLKSKQRACAIFAGYDYTFGYKALGNSDILKEMAATEGIYVGIIEKVEHNNILVSSTNIKKLLNDGDVKAANAFLGYNYRVCGRVVHGKQNGRKIGLPTANIDFEGNKLLPKDGVYSGNAIVDNNRYKCIINIGKNPTFDAQTRTVEAYIADFSKDIYEKYIMVEFKERIRDEKKFSSADDLKNQVEKDLIQAQIK